MQPVTMVSAGCRASRRVLFDARRFNALAFSRDSLPLADARARARIQTHFQHITPYTHAARDSGRRRRSLVYVHVGRTYDHHGREPETRR